MIAVGSTVGNYQVLKQIGSGMAGSVFLAHHPVIGRKVALKVIHPELATSEEMVARFFNEARAVTQIGHANIVEVLDFGQTPDGDSFIVMELLEGQLLGELVKAGPMPVRRALHIAAQMADGLEAAHVRGIIHRDLKPDNVFLVDRRGDPDFVKILDFGLAKLSGPGTALVQHKTKTGSLLGTPHYMAPEQCSGAKNLDARADIYALGCMLYQMVTGRVPFPGEGFGDILVRHVREPPQLPSRVNPAVTSDVEKIVLHALAKKPEFRFPTMDAFAHAMRDPARFASALDTPDADATSPIRTAGAEAATMMAESSQLLPSMTPPPRAPVQLAPSAPTVVGQPAPAGVATIVTAPAKPAQSPSGKMRVYVGNTPPRGSQLPTQPPKGQRTPPHGNRARSPSGKHRPVQRANRWWLVVPVLAAGIATAVVFLLRGTEVTVRVTTDPDGARVRMTGDDSPLGTTPFILHLPRVEESVLLTFERDGYLTAQRTLKPDRNQTVSVHLLQRPPPAPDESPEPAVEPPAASAGPEPSAAKVEPPAAPRERQRSSHGPAAHAATQPSPSARAKNAKKASEGQLLEPSF